MDLYTDTSYRLSKQLMLRYSSSFGISSRLLHASIRPNICALYGLVRIADEIVDTYTGDDTENLLDELEREVFRAIKIGYSANPIVHSFAHTVRHYTIEHDLIVSFFVSMRMDTQPITYTTTDYARYIYGSAEVIGLMCLRVFVGHDTQQYTDLSGGARALGSAYQKINFLRDMAADYTERGRFYFPETTFLDFDESAKQIIISDIKQDLATVKPSIQQLPPSCRVATTLSYVYYSELLQKISKQPVKRLKTTRVRIPTWRKLFLLFTLAFRRISR